MKQKDLIECVPLPKRGVDCYYNCKDYTFIVTTPYGGSCISCPICDNRDEEGWYYDYFNFDDYDYDSDDEEYVKLKLFEYLNIYFCTKCLVPYRYKCSHAVHGCSDDEKFGQLVYKYRLNGVVYNGMPKFSSPEVFLKLAPEMRFCWKNFCPGDSPQCPKGYSSYYSCGCKEKKNNCDRFNTLILCLKYKGIQLSFEDRENLFDYLLKN